MLSPNVAWIGNPMFHSHVNHRVWFKVTSTNEIISVCNANRWYSILVLQLKLHVLNMSCWGTCGFKPLHPRITWSSGLLFLVCLFVYLSVCPWTLTLSFYFPQYSVYIQYEYSMSGTFRCQHCPLWSFYGGWPQSRHGVSCFTNMTCIKFAQDLELVNKIKLGNCT